MTAHSAGDIGFSMQRMYPTTTLLLPDKSLGHHSGCWAKDLHRKSPNLPRRQIWRDAGPFLPLDSPNPRVHLYHPFRHNSTGRVDDGRCDWERTGGSQMDPCCARQLLG